MNLRIGLPILLKNLKTQEYNNKSGVIVTKKDDQNRFGIYIQILNKSILIKESNLVNKEILSILFNRNIAYIILD